MNGILDSIGYGNFIVVIFVLVLVHELGHYWVARACGIKVEVFSIGFGKELFGYTDKSGMRWKFSMIPLGGYVKMKGEMISSSSQSGDSDSFHKQHLLKRILVVVAGPFANYVYAVVLLAAMFIFAGQATQADYNKAGIGVVGSGTVAQAVGLQTGDIITEINDRSISSFTELAEAVGQEGAAGGELNLKFVRQGREFSLTATPQRIEQNGQVFYRLGVGAPAAEYVKQNPLQALWSGVEHSYLFTVAIVDSLVGMVRGTVSPDDLGGPVKIAQISKDFGASGWYALLYLTVILSINLGFLNLLPIPMLDGGHLVFYLAEAVRGRPISVKIQDYLMRFGFGLLGFAIIWITLNDIKQIVF